MTQTALLEGNFVPVTERVAIPIPAAKLWTLLTDVETVVSCIPGAELTRLSPDGVHEATIKVKFGPTVATFRGEAAVAYDNEARRCTIRGRGIDQRGASRATAAGIVAVSGDETTELTIDGGFNVTGPLETFANAGGVHIARALLADFAANIAKLEVAPTPEAPTSHTEGGQNDGTASKAHRSGDRLPGASLSGGRLLFQALLGWLRSLFERVPR